MQNGQQNGHRKGSMGLLMKRANCWLIGSCGVRVKVIPGSVLLLFVQMAVLDAPPQRGARTVERAKASVRAQRFLDVLQGACQLTWEQPEELRQAMSELSTSEEAKAGLRVLWEYLEALSPSLSGLCGVGAGEGEAGTARQTRSMTKSTRKRRKRGSRSNTSGGGGGDVSEVGERSSSMVLVARYKHFALRGQLALAGRQCAIPTLLGGCADNITSVNQAIS
jgi:hypothetical protein